MLNIVYLDDGMPANLPERKTTCITVSPMQAGTYATFSVVVQNKDVVPCAICTVEFFLKRPGSTALPLDPALCLPAANPMQPCSLNPGDSAGFSIRYLVQNGDVGADTLYAQIQQQSPPPGLDPTDMTQIYNAERLVQVVPATAMHAA
jgi:hypothetical protein